MVTWVILVFVSWFASTISGMAGFGGSLIILPVIAYLIGVKKAIPILTIAWLMGNFSRAAFSYKEIQWKPVALFCVGALPGAIIGSLLFVELPAKIILHVIGIFLIIIVVLRRFKALPTLSPRWLIFWGILVGFLSAVIGSAGPIGAAAFLSLNLAPVAYIASEAVTAVFMHFVKTVVYEHSSLLTFADFGKGLVLGLAMVAGSWTSKKLIKKISLSQFGTMVDILMVLAAISLLF